jgi:hypothetical protein
MALWLQRYESPAGWISVDCSATIGCSRTRLIAAPHLPARHHAISSPPCDGFPLLIPDSPHDSFKLLWIRKRVPLGEPAADASHLCPYGLDDRDGFLGGP